MTIDELFEFLIKWAKLAIPEIGNNVIKSNPNAPAPKGRNLVIGYSPVIVPMGMVEKGPVKCLSDIDEDYTSDDFKNTGEYSFAGDIPCNVTGGRPQARLFSDSIIWDLVNSNVGANQSYFINAFESGDTFGALRLHPLNLEPAEPVFSDWTIFAPSSENGLKTVTLSKNADFDGLGDSFQFNYIEQAWKAVLNNTKSDIWITKNAVYVDSIACENIITTIDGKIGPAAGGRSKNFSSRILRQNNTATISIREVGGNGEWLRRFLIAKELEDVRNLFSEYCVGFLGNEAIRPAAFTRYNQWTEQNILDFRLSMNTTIREYVDIIDSFGYEGIIPAQGRDGFHTLQN